MPSPFNKPNIKPPVSIVSSVLEKLGLFHPLSEPLRQAFIERSFEVRVKKGEYLAKEGSCCKSFYFLVDGIVEGYRNHGSKRLTTFICLAGDLISPIGGMYGHKPSTDNIVAAEDCYLITLPATDLQQFYDLYPEMNIVMRKILEVFYECAHERAVLNIIGTAKEKYEYFVQSLPDHDDKADVELVASFLNVKTETLLKIKKFKPCDPLSLTTDINTIKLSALIECMLIDKLYKKQKLSLNDVARHLKLSPHELSQLLNQVYHLNFTDFTNTYRIQFVKEQLKNKNNFESTTIESLGHQAGFSSKSAFFAVFKKVTGLSPLAYAQTQLKSTNFLS